MARGGKCSVSDSPKLQIVIEFAPHEPDCMSDVRDGGCHHRRLLRARHVEIQVELVGATWKSE